MDEPLPSQSGTSYRLLKSAKICRSPGGTANNKQLHSSPFDEMEPASIVAFTGGVLGPLTMLLFRAEPFLNLLRRFVGCLHNPQPRPRRPVRAPWKRD
ncbi:hypothetical protein C2845_PM13G08240 [Panicum miliaceum]|uniref:Uncharacterized protein n=1 Tax=Panicum miliaceum TaxID=4540 RepID=A0A3L6RIC8_PANMI|nr:hypothetical protein C2845_PM13G08240 [Panicum miliaceum]